MVTICLRTRGRTDKNGILESGPVDSLSLSKDPGKRRWGLGG